MLDYSLVMRKKLCENTLFRVLFYRQHKVSFDNFSRRNALMSNHHVSNENTFEWIKSQSDYIDENGLNHWIQHADGSKGIPPPLTLRSTYPFTYTIKFRNNIFFQ